MKVIRFYIIGEFLRDRVRATWTNNSRPIIAEIEEAVEQAWELKQTQARAVHDDPDRRPMLLFDGPMCRLESFEQIGDPPLLALSFSRTSYKPFLGTNLTNVHFADVYGVNCLANPTGVSVALESADGNLMMGRRNQSVAYYPGRIHPFAGALEPADLLDVFADPMRELEEELHLSRSEIGEMKLLGLGEDVALRQPELIFYAKSRLTRKEISARLGPSEHMGVESVSRDTTQVGQFLDDPLLTPIARATVLLWARGFVSRDWFARMCGRFAEE